MVIRYATVVSTIFVVVVAVLAFLLLLGIFGMLGAARVIILAVVFDLHYLHSSTPLGLGADETSS